MKNQELKTYVIKRVGTYTVKAINEDEACDLDYMTPNSDIDWEIEIKDINETNDVYINDAKKFETYKAIYDAIQFEAMCWADDNDRIDPNTIYAYLEAFSDEDIHQMMLKFNYDDIKFVTKIISERKVIYYEN